MSWPTGSDTIAALLTGGELDVVTFDQRVVDLLLVDAQRHLQSADAAKAIGDLVGAYQLAYDAMRKSSAALLAAQGLRATVRGGHIAVQEAVLAQFPEVRAFRAFGRLRRNRNRFEYPDTDSAGPSLDDLEDALTAAAAAHHAAATLVGTGTLTPWG